MAEQHFVDGIENVAIIAGNVRVDFYTYGVDPETSGKEPPKEHNLRLVMSPEAFLKSWQSHNQLLQELKKRGLVTQRDSEQSEEQVSAEPSPATSPNFA
ncbi:hypothetical protein C9I98_25810 [Photobacterium sanctipauli]|uniref:Uncharacterized protein n=1 Tax=Photobacterium sanctipauli TaxID=1342794 RepID=A0A2T3N8G4_9GAMM|nr:hypothetical protein [Photobacterium sanctipauli]PSW09575.1 hypothetical protein C9I98_25810 [Photobacterium sanctipauli]